MAKGKEPKAKSSNGKPEVKKRQRRGRPTKITDEIIERIVSYVRSGAYVETAVVAAGISKQTYYNWMKFANKSEKKNKYTEFVDAVDEARALAEMRDLATINAAADPRARNAVYEQFPEDRIVDGKKETVMVWKKVRDEHRYDWRAAAWRLERKYPHKWGTQVKLEHSGPGNGPIPIKDQHKVVLNLLSTPASIDAVSKLYETIKSHEMEKTK